MSQVFANGQETLTPPICLVVHGDIAVNTGVLTVTTLTPPPGQFVYVVGVDLDISADATGAAVANLKFTSTNLNSWTRLFSQIAGPGAYTNVPITFPAPVKAQAPGQPVSIVSPASQTHTAFGVNIYYYFGV